MADRHLPDGLAWSAGGLLKALRLIGLGAFLIGGGGLVQGDPAYFVTWAVLVYAGLIIAALELLYEHWGLAPVRYLVVLVFGGMLGWFTKEFVLVEAPLTITTWTSEANYPQGTDISGIKWEPFYTEARIRITNNASVSYEDVDLTFRVVGLWVMHVARVEGPELEITPVATGPRPIAQEVKPSGEKVDHPMTPFGTMNTLHHVTTDRMLPRTQIEIVIAVANPLFSVAKLLGDPNIQRLPRLFGPKKQAERIDTGVKYVAFRRVWNTPKGQAKLGAAVKANP